MNKTSLEIKKNILYMAHYSKASHIGSALSVSDILYVLYSKIVDINISNLSSINRDKVILSKGHASIALYATLSAVGLLDKKMLDKYYVDGGILPGHLDKNSIIGVDCSSGSLGHGPSIGLGMALGNKDKNVYVIIGDGETNEGSVWEAIILAGVLKVKNLTFIIDKNNLQGFCSSDECADYSKLSDTLNNFGLDACDVDGHNIKELETVFKKTSSKTKAIVAHTVKGHGISFMENELKWHYKSPNDEELNIALKELGI